LQETVNGITTTFTMDLNTGLTQALSDGTNHYIYGLGRIAQVNSNGTEYFLGDALGSVRQLVNSGGSITYARAYDPYGVVTSTTGSSSTTYGYTSEVYGDSTQLLYLRSRYYSGNTGRFISRDTWNGNANSPMSFNRWNYVDGNPINRTDPSGMCWIISGGVNVWIPDGATPCQSGNTGTQSSPTGTTLPELYAPCPPPTVSTRSLISMLIPRRIDNFMEIKDDPVELIARALLGEEAEKLFTHEEDDAKGVAWAIRNRHDSGKWANREGGAAYNWYWSANSKIDGMKTLRAKDPLNSGYWKTPEDAIRAYNRAREIALYVLWADKTKDITHGAIRWADQYTLDGKSPNLIRTKDKNGNFIDYRCTNCVNYDRTHFDDDFNNDVGTNPWNTNWSSWCVSTVPESECR
jgi:RHS repeat-associated protein